MRKKRAPTIAEEKLGVHKIVPVGDREFEQVATEKMGADGVPEVHVSYEPTKHSGFRKQGAGKGDRFRNVDKKRYDENYRRIFGHD
jgi:hypothetical protein